MAFIGDADPVDGTEYDGFTRAGNDYPAAAEGHFIQANRHIVSQGSSQRGGGIDIEGGYFHDRRCGQGGE